jgi:hypothetical protein
MPPFVDLTNQRFGSLLVLSLASMRRHPKSSEAIWNCQCACGKTKPIASHSLRRGRSTSCGCRNRSHGDGGTWRLEYPREYNIWKSMWQRCTNPKDRHFYLYGERGIMIDPRWRSFRVFLTDLGPKPGKGFSLDRLNNDGPYVPGNVAWRTQAQQTRNMSRNRWITYQGITQCAEDWSRQLGIHRNTLLHRLDQGWPVDMVLSTRRFTRRGWEPSP